MNRLTLAKLKKIAADKGYEVRFDRGCYKILKKVADFDSLSDAFEFLAQNTLPPPPPLPPSPPTQPLPKYDLTVIWQGVLANIPKVPTRALLAQMCFLHDYDGESAIIQCKSPWFDRITRELPTLSTAFHSVSGRAIAVSLEKIPQASTPSQKPPAPKITAPPPPAPKILRPHNTIDISLLSSGKYQIRVLDEIINQGYPDLDGRKYLDVLKTVEISKILDSYPLSVGMKLSIAIPFNSSESWFLNFEIVSLAIQSLKNGNYLLVILQPIPRLTSTDHYLSIYTYQQ